MTNLKRAHNELFRRGPDEIFDSLPALANHCKRQRDQSRDRWVEPQGLKPASGTQARAELAGPEMLLKQLKDLLNRDGATTLTALPNGIHSGLRREKCYGMFFYFQAPRSGEGKRHFWRYIDARSHEIKENRYEIAQLISCLPDEPRYIGDQDVFVMQDKVIDSILATDREAEARAAAPTAVDPIQQTVTEEIKNAIRRRTVDREGAKTCISFLGQPMGRALHGKLREAYDAWKSTQSDESLVEQIVLLADQFGKDKTAGAQINRLCREDLELICFEYVSGYGCVFLPTKPRTPRPKGKIERGIDYVQENALKGRTFASLHDQNDYLSRWEAEVADARVHGTTRLLVGQCFLDVEKAALLPLPSGRLASFRESKRRVHRDGHVEIDKAYYSVPPEYVGQSVWARWDGRVVRVFNMRLVQIAMHAQQPPGKFSTHDQHIVTQKINAVEHGAEYLLVKVRRVGVGCARWAEAMLQNRGVAGVRVLQGLLHLARKNTCEALEKACSAAHAHGEYRLRTVRALLKRQDVTQPLFEFMDEHPLIRPMSDYGQFVRDALREGGSS